MVQSSSTGSRHHKRISSLSTRPTSFHQAQLASLSLTGGGGGAAAGQPSTPQNNRVSSATGSAVSAVGGGNNQSSGDPSSTWEMWDCIRTLCGYHPRLSVSEWNMLDFGPLKANRLADSFGPYEPSSAIRGRFVSMDS